jgi:hypothetical protein
VLAGCPHGNGGSHPSHVAPADGLSVAIYTGVEPAKPGNAANPAPDAVAPAVPPDASGVAMQMRSVALIDDRRTIEVAGDGTIHLEDVADGIELASLIIEPLDGTRFTVQSCARTGGSAATIREHRATVITSDGSTVEGHIRDSRTTDGSWVVEDDAGRAHFVRGIPDEIILHDASAMQVICAVDAVAGAHRVRLAYATSDLSWQSSYRVDVRAEGDGAVASVQPTFTIAGSGVIGARHATVSLLVGLPGGEESPRLAWTGDVDLGTDEVAVHPPTRDIPAQLEYIYRGAVTHKDDNPRIAYWRATSTNDVWFAIGIGPEDAKGNDDLPGGPALFSVTEADGTSRQANGRWPEPDGTHGQGIDVRLWPSADLIGLRERKTPYDDGGRRLIEQYLFGVSNHSDATVTVWVEEELRAGASHRLLRKLWPSKPQQRGDLLRFKVTVKAGGIERLGFEAEYQWTM